MNKKYYLVAVFLMLDLSAFADDWRCTDTATERAGNVFKACGVGEDKNEADARVFALQNAKLEFEELCSASDDCADQAITVTPRRTTCLKQGDTYKCYRLIEFSLGEAKKTENAKLNRKKLKESLYVGMSNAALFKAIGKPTSSSNLEASYTYFYEGEICEDNKYCSIQVMMDEVTSLDGIKMALIKL